MGCFGGFNVVTKIRIPPNITHMGYNAFADMPDLEEIIIEDIADVDHPERYAPFVNGGLVWVASGCFFDTQIAGPLILPSTLKEIGINAFEATHVELVDLSKTRIKVIPRTVFYNCPFLREVKFPNTLDTLGEFCFLNSTTLEYCDLSNTNLKSIHHSAFAKTSLHTMVFPSSLVEIGPSAFYGCTDLTSVTLSASLTSIGASAFQGCSGLTSVTLQSTTPPTLGANAFAGIPAGFVFTCPPEARNAYRQHEAWRPYFHDVIFTVSNGTATVTGLANEAITNLNIPDSVPYNGDSYPVTAIAANAFKDRSGLTSVTFPAGLTSIGDYAFKGCSGLTSVKLLPTTPPTLLTFLKTSPTPTTPDPNPALKTSPNLKSASGNAFEAIPATCTFTCPAYALSRYQASPDWAPYFGAAPTDDDAGDSDKTSIQTVIGGSGESVAALYTIRGQLLKKAVITLPATPSVLRTVFAVPDGLYILATPDGTRKIQL
jgi:hypothetical protein